MQQTSTSAPTYKATKAFTQSHHSVNSDTKSQEINQLCTWIRAKKQKVICILESEHADLSKKFLSRISGLFDLKSLNIIGTEENDLDQSDWYFQPLVNHLPKAGQVTFFNNFWYGRALKKGKFLPKAFSNGQAKIWQNFPQFEKMLLNSGYKILKIWLQDPDNLNEKQSNKAYFDLLLQLTDLTDARWKIAEKGTIEDLTDYCFDLFLSEFQFQDLTFGNEVIPLSKLKKRSFNLHWGMVEKGVIPLTATHPDYPMATEIQRAIKDFNEAGIYPFPPNEGLRAFKNTASKVLFERKQIDCPPELILPIDGENSAMIVAAKTLLNPGEEAIIFDPMDFIFEKSIKAAGGKIQRVSVNLQNRKPNFGQLLNLITSNTKLITFSNPLAPIGKLFSQEELNILTNIILTNNLWVLNNESWSDTIFPPNHYRSIAGLNTQIANKTLTVYGFEKNFGLAGMKTAFLATPNKIVFDKMKKVMNLHFGGLRADYLAQIAGTTAFEKCWYWLDAFNEHLTKMRDFSVHRINEIRGCHCIAPEGTFCLFVNIQGFGLSSLEMAKYLMREAEVAVIPGAKQWFGNQSEGYIRLSFATSQEILSEALDRIERALTNLHTT